jgi:hypothetical protein
LVPAIKGTLDALTTPTLGWNIGALFTLSPTTKVGLSYRSKVKHNLEGSLKTVSGPAAGASAALTTGSFKARRRPAGYLHPVALSQNLNEQAGKCSEIFPGRAGAAFPGVNIVPYGRVHSTAPPC